MVANVIHMKLALKHGLITTGQPFYKYTPQNVLENQIHKLYFDRLVLTDNTMAANRPDITLIDKRAKTTYLIDVAIPNTNNIEKRISEKVKKYTELATETRRLWKMDKVIVIPLVISSTGIIPKQLAAALKRIDLPLWTYEQLQKAVILETCHVVRKFLNTDDTSAEVDANNNDEMRV